MPESRSVKLTRDHFIAVMRAGNPVHDFFPQHVRQVEKWALRILPYYPQADTEVVLLSVWLHDIGHADKTNFSSHEIWSEKEARRFLPGLGLADTKVSHVARCVRTHRCKADAMPETIEAEILAAADSASHMTDFVYILMLNDGNPKADILAKLDRDIRDTRMLPAPLQKELLPLAKIWRRLITVFPG